jgi:hypothetical protein
VSFGGKYEEGRKIGSKWERNGKNKVSSGKI